MRRRVLAKPLAVVAAPADTTAPTVPTNVTASSITSSGFTVSWTASTDAVGVTGYDVQINGTSYATPTTTSVAVTGRAASTAYAVRVRARDAAGNFSALSTAINVTTAAAAAGATVDNIFTTQTPASPNVSDGASATFGTIFSPSVDGQVTGVRFYRATTAPTTAVGMLYGSTGLELARATYGTLTTGWNTVTFATPVAVTAGATYTAAYFTNTPYVASSGLYPLTNDKLTATSGSYAYDPAPNFPGNTSPASFFADVVFSYVPASAPATPSAPTASPSNQAVQLAWAAPANNGSTITGYGVQNVNTSAVTTIGASPFATITGLTNGVAYSFKVRATNAAGTSAYSAASSPVTPVASNGFPDGSNTGAPSGATLTRVPQDATSGTGWTWIGGAEQSIHVDTAGVTLNGLDVSGNIEVYANNVTIQNCRITAPGDGWAIGARTVTGLVVQDCTMSGGGLRMAVGVKDVSGASEVTILRCDVSGYSSGLQTSRGLIQDCYVHGPILQAGDHTNGYTNNGGRADGTMTLRHNTFLNTFDQADAISLFQDFGLIRNITVDNNLLAGGSYALYAGGGPFGTSTNVVITNNHFSTRYFANCGTFGPVSSYDAAGVGNIWSGNVWDDGPNAGQAITPP